MTVFAFTNQKGGCSKSTTSVHFAYWLSRKGNTVCLVDSDAQLSSSIWIKSLSDTAVDVSILQSADEVIDQLPDINDKYDYIVVDGPAGLSEVTRAILFRADVSVIPCQPTGVDLRSAADAVKLVRQAQSVRNGPPAAALFLSRAVKGTKLKDEAITLLSKSNVPILKTVIHQKQCVADTFGQRATVWDLSGKSASESAKEFDQLFQELMEIK
ncbi:MAG: chromosome partitioning protein [Phormidesmis priestleyi Ana]|uniref:Chromosome partitioning protein n=1 Tax=Phormidesmis priestleyi Ana TaxID=1666911 RepID=A0A0P7YNR9_9CYAN|nr:MAG: chromosome partitioning protein [Phormidesmis priestleyi Ana]